MRVGNSNCESKFPPDDWNCGGGGVGSHWIAAVVVVGSTFVVAGTLAGSDLLQVVVVVQFGAELLRSHRRGFRVDGRYLAGGGHHRNVRQFPFGRSRCGCQSGNGRGGQCLAAAVVVDIDGGAGWRGSGGSHRQGRRDGDDGGFDGRRNTAEITSVTNKNVGNKRRKTYLTLISTRRGYNPRPNDRNLNL